MKITNVIHYDIMNDFDYNDTLSLNKNCINNESNTDIIKPSLLLTKPCVLSFFCLLGLMVFTINKPLLNNKRWRNF